LVKKPVIFSWVSVPKVNFMDLYLGNDSRQTFLILFDTSNYPKDHKSGIPTNKNKKIIGIFQYEVGGKQITEFVGLRAKLYSYKIDKLIEEKNCKGINKTTQSKRITFDDYLE